eukprot:7386800-Prymnesium_polylepis.5
MAVGVTIGSPRPARAPPPCERYAKLRTTEFVTLTAGTEPPRPAPTPVSSCPPPPASVPGPRVRVIPAAARISY